VIEVKLDLVRRATNRLVASELELLDEVLVWVLGHPAPLVGVEEHVVDVERGTDKAGVGVHVLCLREVTGLCLPPPCTVVSASIVAIGLHSPQHVLEIVHLKDNLDLVVLESNERDRETRVLAIPELQRNVEGRSRECITVNATSAAHRSRCVTDGFNILTAASGEVGELGSVTDHLIVTLLLASGDSQLVPDVHPVTVLTVDPLTANLDLNAADNLLTRVVEPSGVRRCTVLVGCTDGDNHPLQRLRLDLRESHLKISPVGEVTVPADGASDPATEISLAVESLFNRLCGEVGVSAVCNLPESDLRVASKVNVLSAVCDKLHQSASHSILLLKKRFRGFAPKERYRLHSIRDSSMFLDKGIEKVLGKHLLLALMWFAKHVLFSLLPHRPPIIQCTENEHDHLLLLNRVQHSLLV